MDVENQKIVSETKTALKITLENGFMLINMDRTEQFLYTKESHELLVKQFLFVTNIAVCVLHLFPV